MFLQPKEPFSLAVFKLVLQMQLHTQEAIYVNVGQSTNGVACAMFQQQQ